MIQNKKIKKREEAEENKIKQRNHTHTHTLCKYMNEREL